MDIKKNNKDRNKRKFFRVYSNKPICTEMAIVKVNGELCYGVNFLLDDNDGSDCFTIFNSLALVIKRNVSQHGCNFYDMVFGYLFYILNF